MSRRALVAFLPDLAADLVAAFTAETFDRAVPLRVGARARRRPLHRDRGSIERTLALLGCELAARTPADAERLGLLQGAVAAGYARALQDRTRREQERRSAAALAARAAAEQARWDSEARFRTVFAEAVIGIGLADTEGRVLEVNRALAEMLGRPESALRGATISTFVHPDDVPALWDRTTELLAGERDRLRVDQVVLPPRRLRGVDRPRALARPRPARRPAVPGRGDGERHRAAPPADPAAAPGAARPAHRPAQPHPVLRAARRRAARRDGAGRVLPRSRRVHRGQRHPRTRQGRRPPADRGAPPDRGARRPAPGGPHGRRRVRGPRRARRGRRHAAPGGPGGPGRRASPGAARRPRGRRVGEHRRGARRRRPGRRRADEGGRHHALLGEVRRPQPVRDVRRGPPPQRRRPLRGRGPHARGAGPRRVQPGVPASGAAGRPHRGRGGGARALDAAGRQAARPRTLRPARRRQRVHRAAGPVGARRRRAGTPPGGPPRTRRRAR